MRKLITVFGSINADLMLRCAALPAAGETVLATHSAVAAGGKGGNQAFAAAANCQVVALAGAVDQAVAMVGAVGKDALADAALAGLQARGVDLAAVKTVDACTGVASVAVNAAGENQIIVASGANAHVLASDLTDELLAKTAVFVAQMELPSAEVFKTIARAKSSGAKTLLNNTPAGFVPLEVLRLVDVLVVNGGELRQTCEHLGLPADTSLQTLAQLTGGTVVVTLGARGAVAATGSAVFQAAAVPVKVRDTTGAGDAFCGAFAVAMRNNLPLPQALAAANAAGSQACTVQGAQAF